MVYPLDSRCVIYFRFPPNLPSFILFDSPYQLLPVGYHIIINSYYTRTARFTLPWESRNSVCIIVQTEVFVKVVQQFMILTLL